MSEWTYQGREILPEDLESQYGFVYLITNLTNNRKYIGRKYLTKASSKKVKGKTKKIRVESDWKTYFGSSDELKKDVEVLGEENFKREILKFCKGRGEVNYWETKYIFESDALLSNMWYNNWCSAKIHANHVKGLWKNDEST